MDDDLSTREIRTMLSSHPTAADEMPGPKGWNRRRFLQAIGAGLLAGPGLGTFVDTFLGGDLPDAWAGPPAGPDDRILVNVMLFGGLDTLNAVVPYADATYRLAVAARSRCPPPACCRSTRRSGSLRSCPT